MPVTNNVNEVTISSEEVVVNDPYEMLDDVFDDMDSFVGLSGLRNRLSNFVRAASTNMRAVNTSDIRQLVFSQQDFQLVLEAADFMRLEILREEGHLLEENSTTTRFTKVLTNIDEPDNLPSFLRQDECHNPEIVISNFFSQKTVFEWKKMLHKMLDAALGGMSMAETIDEPEGAFPIDVIQMYRVLEATWIKWVMNRIE